MKKLLATLTLMLSFALQSSAMSYEQACEKALFLTDKMAYELNLTDEQYEAAYEINLDYLMSLADVNDIYGIYWEQRNLDLSYILLDWQYRAYLAASYFYRPIYWDAGYWHFGIYARYPYRDYFYFGRPHFYLTYRGGHSWRMNGGHSWYHGHNYGPKPGGHHFGMHDKFQRGDFGKGFRDGHGSGHNGNHGGGPGGHSGNNGGHNGNHGGNHGNGSGNNGNHGGYSNGHFGGQSGNGNTSTNRSGRDRGGRISTGTINTNTGSRPTGDFKKFDGGKQGNNGMKPSTGSSATPSSRFGGNSGYNRSTPTTGSRFGSSSTPKGTSGNYSRPSTGSSTRSGGFSSGRSSFGSSHSSGSSSGRSSFGGSRSGGSSGSSHSFGGSRSGGSSGGSHSGGHFGGRR